MNSFKPGLIESQHLSQKLLQTVRMIGEFKGKQELFKEQSPQLLETLQQVAVIQSTESSNRIEGITAPSQRLQQLIARKVTPQNLSEQEIAGYRDVLNTIHANYRYMSFTSGLVLQLHRDLTQFVPSRGGTWKQSDNDIIETQPDGTQFVRFKPVPAYLTADAMSQLHEAFLQVAIARNRTSAIDCNLCSRFLVYSPIFGWQRTDGSIANLTTSVPSWVRSRSLYQP